MNAQETENFRTAILNVLEERAGNSFGIGLPAIRIFLGQYAFRNLPEKEIATELLYLQDKLLVVTVGKQINPENRAWRITAAGRDFLAQ